MIITYRSKRYFHDWDLWDSNKMPKLQTCQITRDMNFLAFVSQAKLFPWYCKLWAINASSLRLFQRRGRPSFKHALIYSPIHASRLYSKHPLAFSVEQRKPFGSEGILSYVRFLRTLPFRIYIPNLCWVTPETKKFKFYVSLHLVPLFAEVSSRCWDWVESGKCWENCFWFFSFFSPFFK